MVLISVAMGFLLSWLRNVVYLLIKSKLQKLSYSVGLLQACQTLISAFSILVWSFGQKIIKYNQKLVK